MFFLAVIPAVIIFVIVYRSDRIEKEPLGFLIRLMVAGGLTIISAILIGLLGQSIVTAFVSPDTLLFLFIDNFLLTALVEEGGKYYVLKKKTWNSAEFNYTFDAVVYAVAVSLGFALVENILYLIDGDLITAILRGVLSVPGHAIDGIFMGYYYGLAKKYEWKGAVREKKQNLRKALLVPVIIHGFYDFCLETGSDVFYFLFFIFEIILTVFAVHRFRKLSREDDKI